MDDKRIVDSHAHVFPDRLGESLPSFANSVVNEVRRRGRQAMWPVSSTFHRLQTIIRHLPEPLQKGIDEIGSLGTFPSLLVESTPSDLTRALTESAVDHVVVIASPPHSTNEFVLELASEDPRIIPVVNLPSDSQNSAKRFKTYVRRGAKALKIHPAMDGEGPDSPRYHSLIKAAAELGLPVIIHTGCIHMHLFYKNPEYGHAENFKAWFAEYPTVNFILAHMNYHRPATVLDLAEEFQNIYTDTSWQPAEMIGEAVRRIGADRILFGSDWPLIGHNLSIGIQRIHDCVTSGMITEDDSRKILGANAIRIFKV